jgi:hypothetical protein
LAGPTEKGTSDRADEVTLARKGAKSRKRITGLRSKTTKARTHVDRLRAANADLKKKLAEALEQQNGRLGRARPQVSAAQELQIKAQTRLASLMEEKLVTRISVLSTFARRRQNNRTASRPHFD